MAKRIHLEIVTPEGVRLSEDVDELTAPSVQGEFGVLPEHRPLLAGLRTGIVKYRIGGDESLVAIGPGFAKVAGDGVSILTDHYIAKADIDAVVARKDLKEAEEALAALSGDADANEKARHIAAVRWAAVRLELYGDPPPATVMLEHEIRLLGHEDYSEALLREGSPGDGDQDSPA